MKKYNCRTNKGQRLLTEDEIIDIGYDVIRQLLCSPKYEGYRYLHEDLTQTAIGDVWMALPRYRASKATIEGFIFGIAKRAITKALLKEVRYRQRNVGMTDEMESRLEATPAPEPDEPEEKTTADQIDELRRFIETLNKTEKRAIALKEEGKSNTEIYNALHPRAQKRRIGKAMTAFWGQIRAKYEKWKIKEDNNASKHRKD